MQPLIQGSNGRMGRVHLLGDFFRLADEGEAAAAEFCSLAHEMTVRRAADADGEQAAVAEAPPDHAEQFRFVADAAVGQQDQLPEAARIDAVVER